MVSRREMEARLAQEAAAAARGTDGVAFLRPGLGDVVRGAARLAPPTGGVRVRYEADRAHWRIGIQLVAAQDHRAVDVTRAVRAAVESAASAVLAQAAAGPEGTAPAAEGGCHVSVSVTITGVA